MTQGGNDPPTPPSSPSTASLSGAARCWHSNAYFRYFLRYFSSNHRTDLSRFRGTFHSFDPVGFAIFAIIVPAPPSRGGSRTLAQHLGQRIGKMSWLGELENISVGHGVSLLCWRSGGVELPHDTPPYPFMPSPTSAHSYCSPRYYRC